MTDPLRIAVLFEYGTLNGGEHSLLAAVDHVPADSPVEFVAIAPRAGRLVEALAARGIAHHPLDWTNSNGERLPSAQIHAALDGAIAAIRPGLVHANSLSAGRVLGRLASELAVPTTCHIRDIIGLSAAAMADLNRHRRLFAVSQATKDYHVAEGLEAARAEVLYNGVNCSRFAPRPATGSLRGELGLPDDAWLIATIGQIGLRKGQDTLAAAAALLAEELPSAHYVLVGERNSLKAESVAFEQAITRTFEDAGLASRLHRLGYREDVADLLSEIDLVVHPARQEPLGRVLLEAGAAGRTIIATDVGGTREIFENGRSAILIPPNDVAALANAIRVLASNRATCDRLGTAARERIATAFRIEDAAARLVNAWRSVAEKPENRMSKEASKPE